MMDVLLSPAGVAAAIALVLAGAVQGSTGYGFSMLAAPILAIIDPAFVPGPMLAMAVAVSASGAITEWNDVSRPDLAFSLSGRLLAAIAAAFCLGLLSPDSFAIVFGAAVLIAVAFSFLGMKIEATRTSLFFAGAMSGFMGTLTSIGSPPMAMVYQNSSGPRMRATLNAFFVVGGAISIVALILVGRFSTSDVLLAAMMLPFAFAGFLLSGWGRRLVDRGRVKVVVLIVSSASAFVLLFRGLL